MSPVLYALNIGTLTVWLSVTSVSTMAWLAPEPSVHKNRFRSEDLTVVYLDSTAASAAEPAAAGDPVETAEASPPEVAELPEVPPMPETTDLAPLPEIPAIAARPMASKPPSKPAAGTTRRTSSASLMSVRTGGAGPASQWASAGGNGRLWQGNIPKPDYPAECRAAGQEGRVVVTFTIDEAGRVISAKMVKRSPYAAMNEAALEAVYRGRFPAGPGQATAIKTIVFTLR